MSDAPVTEPRPSFTHTREKHGLVGPFSGRQLALGAILVVAVAIGLVVATLPLGSVNPLPPKLPATKYCQFVPKLVFSTSVVAAGLMTPETIDVPVTFTRPSAGL